MRIDLSKTWELLLAHRLASANELIDQIESRLSYLPPLAARRVRASAQLLRAVSLAFDDHWLAAFTLAQMHMDRNGSSRASYIALTLYKMGFWKLARHDAFQAMPRRLPKNGCSPSEATSAAFDLSIEAAFAIDHLRLATAKRLATDALSIFQAARSSGEDAGGGLVLLPLSLMAQVHYEQGEFNEAERLIGDRLPLVNAEGSIESALRSYLVLARIARQRARYDLAAILLRAGEALGERRGWPRLVMACIAERVSLLIELGRSEEARRCLENCVYSSIEPANQQGWFNDETAYYQTISHYRLAWAEAPSEKTLKSFEGFYRRAVEFGTPYAGCRLAAEYATMLAAIGEISEADEVFFSAVKCGAAAGLYQSYLEGGEETGVIVKRIYDRIDHSASADRDLLPLLGGLLFRWQAQSGQRQLATPAYVNGNALTRRELDIMARVRNGSTNKSIARTLDISPETVKSHIKRIFFKLGVSSRGEAISKSMSLGLL